MQTLRTSTACRMLWKLKTLYTSAEVTAALLIESSMIHSRFIVLLQMGPTTVLTSCKQDYQLQKALESYGKQMYKVFLSIYCHYKPAQPSSSNQDQPSIATIEALPSSDFGQLIESSNSKYIYK